MTQTRGVDPPRASGTLRTSGTLRISGRLAMGFVLLGLVHCTDASSPPPSIGPNQPDLPNIVLIIIDTLRADRLGVYGFDGPISPELDAYARAGVRFDRVVAQTTWTRPSIGSMLTALYPRSLGLYREKEEMLDDRFTTLAEVLQGSGYWTVGATANPNINSYFNFQQGFDEYVDSDVVFPFMPQPAGQQATGEGAMLPTARALFDGLEETVRRHKGRRPTYLQVNLMEVHEHRHLPPMEGQPYDALAAVESRALYLDYAKAVRRVSLETDRFIRRLRALPGWENSLFVIISDHGETLAADHLALVRPRWHGFLLYETQTLVPWFMFDTTGRLPAGRVVRRSVRVLDLMPTVLDVVGVPPPDGLAGVSLLPLLTDPNADVGLPEWFVVETRFRTADKAAVYSDKWIYVENRDGHAGTNPREIQRVGSKANGASTDLSGLQPKLVKEFAAYLEGWDADHPPAEPVMRRGAVPDTTMDQLRALGYVD